MSHRTLAVALCALGVVVACRTSPVAAQTAVASPAASATPAASSLPAASVPTATKAATAAPTASAAPATPAPPPKLIQFSGDASAAYEHYAGSITTPPPLRTFDIHPDAFNLNAVDVKAQVTLPAGVGITAESVFGTDADVLASRGTSNTDGFDLPNAYLSYTHGSFDVIVGRFASLAGAEVFEDPQDYEFSRSILYGYAEPFTHTGVRATYGFDGGKYTINAGLNNGWDDIKFVGKKHTFEFGPSVVISPAFTLAAVTYNGQDYTNNYAGGPIMNDGDVGNRTLYDVVLTTKATSALTLVSNYDNGSQQNVTLHDASGATLLNPDGTGLLGSAHWVGFSQIANYQFTPKYAVALRGESYHDGGGFHTGYDTYDREGTATFAYTPSSQLLFRLEYRADGSNEPIFGQTNGSFLNHQNSFEIESAAKF